jgi:hypothetical protein
MYKPLSRCWMQQCQAGWSIQAGCVSRLRRVWLRIDPNWGRWTTVLNDATSIELCMKQAVSLEDTDATLAGDSMNRLALRPQLGDFVFGHDPLRATESDPLSSCSLEPSLDPH